jgi:hypothetical protein
MWWFGGLVVEDSGIGLVQRGRSGFGVGDGFRGSRWYWRRWRGVGFEGKVDAAAGIHGVGGMNEAA